MFLTFCKIILGLLYSCELRFTKLSLVDLRVHVFFMNLFVLLCLVCFLGRLCLFGVFGHKMGHVHFLIFSVKFCFLYPQLLHSFCRTIVICILSLFVVCYNPIFCSFGAHFFVETFRVCLGFPLRLCRIFLTRCLLSWWYVFCILLFFRLIPFVVFFLGFFGSFCYCIFVLIIFFGIF